MVSTLQRTNGGLFSVLEPLLSSLSGSCVAQRHINVRKIATTVGRSGGGGHPFLLTAIEATLSLRRCRSVLEQEPELWLRRSSAREDKRRDSCQSFACSAGCMYVRGGGFFRVEHKQCPEVGSFAVTALFKTQNGCNFKDSFIFQLLMMMMMLLTLGTVSHICLEVLSPPPSHTHIEVKPVFGLIRIRNRIASSRGQRVRYEPNWRLRFSSHVAPLLVKCRWAPVASTQFHEDYAFSVLMCWQALRLDKAAC